MNAGAVAECDTAPSTVVQPGVCRDVVAGTLNSHIVLDFRSGQALPVVQAFGSVCEDETFAHSLLPQTVTRDGVATGQSAIGSSIPAVQGGVGQNGNTRGDSEPRFRERYRPTLISGPPAEYKPFGQCNRVCRYCHAMFWDEEKLSTSAGSTSPLYHRCCLQGRVKLFVPRDYPPLIHQLFSDAHFLENIRAYNKMFAMTSLGQGWCAENCKKNTAAE